MNIYQRWAGKGLKKAGAIVLVAAFLSQGFGQGLNPREKTAYQTLARAPYFAIGGVGVAGRTSAGESAYRTLLESPGAASAFRTLLRDRKTAVAGRLYALLGLRAKAPEVFRRELKPYLAAREDVSFMRGCIRSETAVSEIAKRIQKGEFSPDAASARRPSKG